MQPAIRISYLENAGHLSEAYEEAGILPRRIIPKWVQNLVSGLAFGAGLIWAFVAGLSEDADRGILMIWLVGLFGILFLWHMVLWALGFRSASNAQGESYKKAYRKLTGRDQIQVVCEFGDVGFLVTSEGGHSSHSPWSAVVRAVERPKGLLLFTAPQIFDWFPKTVFASAAEYDSLLQLVAAKVPRFQRLPSTG